MAFIKRWAVRLWDEFEEDLTPGLPFALMFVLLLVAAGAWWLVQQVI